jgi:hypothetical protein
VNGRETLKALGLVIVGVLSAIWGFVKIPWWIVRLVALTVAGKASVKRLDGAVHWTVD